MQQITNLLHDDECIDDLQCGGLMLMQKKDGFKFGIDAVLLSDFAKGTRSERTLDLCTGTGIIPMLLSAKTDTPRIDALEIQSDICDMAKRSVIYNSLEDRIYVTEGDLKDALSVYGKASFDKITVNPPYMKCGTGIVNDTDTKTISRHEVKCTLEDVISVSAQLLKPKGRLYMVHRATRIADILYLMRKYKIEPKLLRLVHPSVNKAANLLLIEGMRGAAADLKLMGPLYVYDENGNYSEEINRIYGR